VDLSLARRRDLARRKSRSGPTTSCGRSSSGRTRCSTPPEWCGPGGFQGRARARSAHRQECRCSSPSPSFRACSRSTPTRSRRTAPTVKSFTNNTVGTGRSKYVSFTPARKACRRYIPALLQHPKPYVDNLIIDIDLYRRERHDSTRCSADNSTPFPSRRVTLATSQQQSAARSRSWRDALVGFMFHMRVDRGVVRRTCGYVRRSGLLVGSPAPRGRVAGPAFAVVTNDLLGPRQLFRG